MQNRLTYQSNGRQLDAMVLISRKSREDLFAKDHGKNGCFAEWDSFRRKSYTVQGSLDILSAERIVSYSNTLM